jgi:hypothetical protein
MGGRRDDGYQDQYQQYGQKRREVPPPTRDEAPRKPSKWGMVSVIFAILTVVLLAVSILLPWYSNENNTGGKDFGVRFGLLNAEVLNDTGSTKLSYSDGTFQYNKNVAWLMKATLGVTVIAVLLAALMIPITFMVGKGKAGRGVGLAFGALVMLFCLIAPVMVLVGMPMANKKDLEGTFCDEETRCVCEGPAPCDSFQGSKDFGDSGMWSWGGDWGWMLAWAAWGFSMVSMASLLGVYSPPKKDRSGMGAQHGAPGGGPRY